MCCRWKRYVELELSVHAYDRVENLFVRCLLKVPDIQLFSFLSSDMTGMLNVCLKDNVQSVNAQQPFYHGMLSFALEQVGNARAAELAARTGVQIEQDDPWRYIQYTIYTCINIYILHMDTPYIHSTIKTSALLLLSWRYSISLLVCFVYVCIYVIIYVVTMDWHMPCTLKASSRRVFNGESNTCYTVGVVLYLKSVLYVVYMCMCVCVCGVLVLFRLEKYSYVWQDCMSFLHTHNNFHLALFYLDAHRLTDVARVYDTHIFPVNPHICNLQSPVSSSVMHGQAPSPVIQKPSVEKK